ncbi:MAG: hypothetical protein AWU57_1498 [Marinobacter sp. T13-3]|nr:MAG: hypothetical protein AWU57_1498 [Marinobacter sp. T13-3]
MLTTESVGNRSPFDQSKTLHDESGAPIKFVQSPTDEHYLHAPGSYIPDGMLPPEDHQVREALMEMKLFTEKALAFSFISRLFRTANFKKAESLAREKQSGLMRLVNSSLEHKAAIRRIVNSMPDGNGGREALLRYTK